MAPGHIFQVFLCITIQNQICIAQWVIVDKKRKSRGKKNELYKEGATELGQYRIILSADTASEVRQMLSQKRR